MTKSKARAKRPSRTTNRKKPRSRTAPSRPPEADIPPLDVPIPEAPGHLRKREEAFKKRRGVTR